MRLVPRILRFGLPVGTAFVVCGIHEIIPLCESIFELVFGLIHVTGAYNGSALLECTQIPLFEDEHIIHPHEYSNDSGSIFAEDMVSALIKTTAILLYWIGFLFKGSKSCLLLWIFLSIIAVIFRCTYYMRYQADDEGIDESFNFWPFCQVFFAILRCTYMGLLGAVYVINSRIRPDPFADDLKPVGIGASSFFKYYCNTECLRNGIIALATAPLLDIGFFYLGEMPLKMVQSTDILELVLILIAIEAVPYVILLVVLNKMTTIKWVEYWRSGFLAICVLWALGILATILIGILSCGFGYFLSLENSFNTFIVFYILTYKLCLHRFSLEYVKKFRNSYPLEMADVHIANDLIYESTLPFASTYDC